MCWPGDPGDSTRILAAISNSFWSGKSGPPCVDLSEVYPGRRTPKAPNFPPGFPLLTPVRAVDSGRRCADCEVMTTPDMIAQQGRRDGSAVGAGPVWPVVYPDARPAPEPGPERTVWLLRVLHRPKWTKR